MLDRRRPYGTDPDGDCLFTQTCSYTLFTTARGEFTVLGAPAYTAPGCSGPQHRSFIVVRDTSYIERLDDLRGKSFAINEMNSNSGMNAPRLLFSRAAANGKFFERTIVSGGHMASAELVRANRVDAAAIDCVTFALLARYHPASVHRLRIIGETHDSPTPPFVTSRRTSARVAAALRDGLSAFFTDPAHAHTRAALFLGGIAFCDESDYDVVMEYERAAQRNGYPVLG